MLISPDQESSTPGQLANVEPLAFQVTDQAVALHRDLILERPHKLDFCSVRQPSDPDDFVAPVIYSGNDVMEIDVDFLQLDLTVSVEPEAKSLFLRSTFPTRLFLKRDPTVNELKNEFRRYGHLSAHELLSDFNLLVFLASLENLKDEMQSICDCVRLGSPLQETALVKLKPYMGSASGSGAGLSVPFTAAAPAPAASAPGAGSSEGLEVLMSMGYSSEQAKFALDAAGGDVNSAVNILLNT
eukprot:TRINITY_DN2887_c0_g1_i3.p3 TRINITY_DN2887_c0_g1~~TRINITY_DN2887_c0_g1_i3.p3  ORF type:complete len:242 (-),score=61.28 TRINITY_DN2887_c0_g1_i3:196-921(-)